MATVGPHMSCGLPSPMAGVLWASDGRSGGGSGGGANTEGGSADATTTGSVRLNDGLYWHCSGFFIKSINEGRHFKMPTYINGLT